MKELAQEVEKVDDPEKISDAERKHLHTKLAAVTQKVVLSALNSAYMLSSFATLVPFNKLIDLDIQQLAKDTIQKKEEGAKAGKAKRSAIQELRPIQHISDKRF